VLDPGSPPLAPWESFYVITGSSGGALTGLMFVVVALQSEARLEDAEGGVRAFGSPTVVHFCAVLLLSSILCMPGHSSTTLGVCVGAVGLGGLGIGASVLLQARRLRAYVMVRSDWIWHVALPFVAYAAVVGSGVAVRAYPGPSLHAVAAAVLFLLFIGIHNAWDAAVWIVTRGQAEHGDERKRSP
jgi:hypothetical protein